MKSYKFRYLWTMENILIIVNSVEVPTRVWMVWKARTQRYHQLWQNEFVFMNLPNQSRELVPTPITGLSRNSRLINKKTTTPIWYKRSRKRNICAWKTIKKESKHSLTRDYINLFLISLAVEFNSDE